MNVHKLLLNRQNWKRSINFILINQIGLRGLLNYYFQEESLGRDQLHTNKSNWRMSSFGYHIIVYIDINIGPSPDNQSSV